MRVFFVFLVNIHVIHCSASIYECRKQETTFRFARFIRVLVPPSLRKNAHLEKEVVLVGVQDRVEIWDKALWEEKNQISEEDLDAIAERMEAIGIRI